MGWVSVSMVLDRALCDALTDALLDRGALSVDVADADAGTERESARYDEPGEPAEGYWPRARVSALFEERVDHRRALERACTAAGVPVPAEVDTRAVGDEDWVAATQRQFEPIPISPRLWVMPSWSAVPVTAAITLRVDPGLAFGTGSHPTTRQCLRWLDQHLHAGCSVLDYGCGSGILAIAARKLGAARVVGVDVDPNALRASLDNAIRNGVDLRLASPADLGEESFDVVVANILANPLRALAPLLSARTHGAIVLAGILERQAAAVREAYAPWVDLRIADSAEGWTCLAGRRKL